MDILFIRGDGIAIIFILDAKLAIIHGQGEVIIKLLNQSKCVCLFQIRNLQWQNICYHGHIVNNNNNNHI